MLSANTVAQNPAGSVIPPLSAAQVGFVVVGCASRAANNDPVASTKPMMRVARGERRDSESTIRIGFMLLRRVLFTWRPLRRAHRAGRGRGPGRFVPPDPGPPAATARRRAPAPGAPRIVVVAHLWFSLSASYLVTVINGSDDDAPAHAARIIPFWQEREKAWAAAVTRRCAFLRILRRCPPPRPPTSSKEPRAGLGRAPAMARRRR